MKLKLKPSLFPVIFLITMLGSLLPSGCTTSPERPKLERIEALIDEHPDSATALLAEIDTAALRSDRDRALYHLLHNLALYKSFNDSLDETALKHAVDVFINTGDLSRASKSLYLLGNLQMNQGNPGNSAISFMKGIEQATKCKDYFNEGLCSKSLSDLYGDYYDTKQQLAYAKQATEAFRQAHRHDWELYSMLDIATAHNNCMNFDSSIVISRKVLSDSTAFSDNTLMALASETLGLGAFATKNESLAALCYADAIRYDITTLKSNDAEIIRLLSLRSDSIAVSKENLSLLNGFIKDKKGDRSIHSVHADRGNYEEAYEALNEYRKEQDLFISNIVTRSIDYYVEEYRENESKLLSAMHAAEHKVWLFCSGSVIIILIVLGLYQSKRHRLEREILIRKASFLTKDLDNKNQKISLISSHLKELLNDKFKNIEYVCSTYQENNSKQTAERIRELITSFNSDKSLLEKIEYNINSSYDNLLIDLRTEIPDIKELDYKLYVYTILGFSGTSIALILNKNRDVVYNRKSRLKRRLKSLPKEKSARFLIKFE